MDNREVNRLLLKIKSGDRAAFDALYSEMYKPVCSVAYMIVRDFAKSEDIAQETFLTVYNKCNLYKQNRNASSWLFTIARNLALDTIKKTRRENVSGVDDLLDTIDIVGQADLGNPEDIACDHVFLNQLIRNLSQIDRQIVVMHLIAELRHREIATILNLPLGTVLRRYRESLKKLYRMSEEGDRS